MSKLIASLSCSSGNFYQLNSGKKFSALEEETHIGGGEEAALAGQDGLGPIPAPSVLNALFSCAQKWGGINNSSATARSTNINAWLYLCLSHQPAAHKAFQDLGVRPTTGNSILGSLCTPTQGKECPQQP